TRDRAAQLHRERHPARCDAHLRSARDDLPSGFAAARRRRDPAGGTDRGGGVLPAADGEPAAEPRARHAASRGDWTDGRKRRGGHRRVGRERTDFPLTRRPHRSRAHAGRPPRAFTQPDSGAAEGPPADGGRLMRYNPFRNLWLKVLAIALASLLW